MKKFEAAYVPIGVGTFHMESAQAEFEKTKSLLKEVCSGIRVPDEILLTLDKLNAFLDKINPDLIILQNITFANAAYSGAVFARFSCPVVLWALKEPAADGTRLRLNSLTGSYSSANAYYNFTGRKPIFIFGSPQEAKVKRSLEAAVSAAYAKYRLKNLKMAQIGHTPEGFGFGRALDIELLKNFGVTLESVESRELINRAKNYSDKDIEEYLKDAHGRIRGLEDIAARNVSDFARLYKAYAEYVRENNIGAVASRCWPDFFTDFGTPVCAVLSILNDLGVAAACEADLYGALSMFTGMVLSKKSVFFGDPAYLDEENGTITFWHCGMAPCSLARKDTGACAGLHCNRHIGPTMEFGCEKEEAVTIFRIGRKPDSTFRFFIETGRAPDKEKQFYGTTVVVETDTDAGKIVRESIREGFEPHYGVIFADVAPELRMLADMLGMEVWSV